MINMSESNNFSAQSVDNDGNIVMSMNASITDGNMLYFRKSISDVFAYLDNKEIADSDFEEFENAVLEKLR